METDTWNTKQRQIVALRCIHTENIAPVQSSGILSFVYLSLVGSWGQSRHSNPGAVGVKSFVQGPNIGRFAMPELETMTFLPLAHSLNHWTITAPKLVRFYAHIFPVVKEQSLHLHWLPLIRIWCNQHYLMSHLLAQSQIVIVLKDIDLSYIIFFSIS